jgi:hypothetical protein
VTRWGGDQAPSSRRETEPEPTTKLDAEAPTAQNTIAAGRTSELDDTTGTPAAAERSGASAVLKLFPGKGAPPPPPPGDPPAAAPPGGPPAAAVPEASAALKHLPGKGASPPPPPPLGDPPTAAVRSRASTVLKLFPGKSAPPPPPGDPPAAPAPAQVATGLGGNVIRNASDERILGVSDECNAGDLGVTDPPMIEVVPSGAVESTVEPTADVILDVSDECNASELGNTYESKFEPDVTAEPKVAVIPGAATQGDTHPADRPSDTAKRKIVRERQGRGGRPDPGARKGDATVGRSACRTARRGGYQAPSCLARGRS